MESKVRAIVAEERRELIPVLAGVHRQMALALDQIDRTRYLHESHRRQLLRIECYVGTEIMHLSPRPPFYYDDRWHDRQSLKQKLLQLNQERRKLEMSEQNRIDELHNRLLALWNQHLQIKPA